MKIWVYMVKKITCNHANPISIQLHSILDNRLVTGNLLFFFWFCEWSLVGGNYAVTHVCENGVISRCTPLAFAWLDSLKPQQSSANRSPSPILRLSAVSIPLLQRCLIKTKVVLQYLYSPFWIVLCPCTLLLDSYWPTLGPCVLLTGLVSIVQGLKWVFSSG